MVQMAGPLEKLNKLMPLNYGAGENWRIPWIRRNYSILGEVTPDFSLVMYPWDTNKKTKV